MKVKTLIDTGCGLILVERRFALKMLDISAEQLAASEQWVEIVTPGGEKTIIRAWKGNLRLRASNQDADYLSIPNAWVFVTEKVIPDFPALFGQLDGLQERWLAHHNRGPNGFWQLRG